jgi:transglutaminase-like putative cysteine protease
MTRVLRRSLVPCLAAVAALLLLGPAPSEAFSEITAQERSLTGVPGDPDASAVVLFRKAEISIPDPMKSSADPLLKVRIRRKILKEDGKKYGEVTIHHSQWTRLAGLKGRTVLPDGREVPLPEKAVFKRKTSASEKSYVTTVAFPSVEVGSILDYQYEIRFPSIFWLEPWYFQEEVPTLYSEVTYDVPGIIEFKSWMFDPMRTGVRSELSQGIAGNRVRAWGENLRAVPDEPFNLPFTDLASRFMIVPLKVHYPTEIVELFNDWASTCNLFHDQYEQARKKSKATQAKAKSLTAGLGDRKEVARALFRFVRDEIETDPTPGVGLAEKTTADSMLQKKRGDLTGKAVLLWTMLHGAGFDARLVWVADRWSGRVDTQIANYSWFERALVAVDLDGQRVFLDPADRTLSFGAISPDLEGTTALLVDRKTPEVITLPTQTYEKNLRQARVELDLDAEGRLTGRGTLTLDGHHAWQEIFPRSADESLKAWTDWLAERYAGFDVADVKVRESVDDQRVELTWTLAQPEEEVLGDEVTFTPSLPLGPVTQPFPLPMSKRLSPILFRFADRDDLELTVRWPEGWQPEILPQAKKAEGAIGLMDVTLAVDAANRTLTYRRRFDIREARLGQFPQLEAIQKLYAEMEKSDAQTLALVKR